MDTTNNQQSAPPTFKSAESLCKGFRPSALAVCGDELRALHKQQSSTIHCENGETRETKNMATADLSGYKRDPNFNHTRTGVSTILINQMTGKMAVGPRMRSHGEGTMAAPGGHLDAGECHEETSEREVSEELNIKIRDAGTFGSTYDNFASHLKGVRLYETNHRVAFTVDPYAQPEILESEKEKTAGYDFEDVNWVLAAKMYAEPALFKALSRGLDIVDKFEFFARIREHCGLPTDDLIKGDGTLEDQHKIVSALEGLLHGMQKKLEKQQQQFNEAHWKPLQWSVSDIEFGLQQATEDLLAMQE